MSKYKKGSRKKSKGYMKRKKYGKKGKMKK